MLTTAITVASKPSASALISDFRFGAASVQQQPVAFFHGDDPTHPTKDAAQITPTYVDVVHNITAQPDSLFANGFSPGGQNETCATYNLLKLERDAFLIIDYRRGFGILPRRWSPQLSIELYNIRRNVENGLSVEEFPCTACFPDTTLVDLAYSLWEADVYARSKFNENLLRSVDELDLSVRAENCLQAANIKYIGDLVQKSEGEMLDFLATDWRNIPDRQRSMRAILERTWALLTPAEARALARLALFRGGFRREAADAVAAATLPTYVKSRDCRPSS